MVWCSCKKPKIKESRKILRKDDKCLNCGKKIRKYYKTKDGKLQSLRVAQEEHECKGCYKIIQEGELYFQMSVDGELPFEPPHIWALCLNCCPKRGDKILI